MRIFIYIFFVGKIKTNGTIYIYYKNIYCMNVCDYVIHFIARVFFYMFT